MSKEHQPSEESQESADFDITKSPFFYTKKKEDLVDMLIQENDVEKIDILKGKIGRKINAHHKKALALTSVDALKNEIALYGLNFAYLGSQDKAETLDLENKILSARHELEEKIVEIEKEAAKPLVDVHVNVQVNDPKHTKKEEPVVKHLQINSSGQPINGLGLAFDNAKEDKKPDDTKPKPTLTPVEKPKKQTAPEKAEAIEQISIKTFDDLTELLTKRLPERKTRIEVEEGENLFKQSVEVLENTSKEAKKGGLEAVSAQIEGINKLQEAVLENLKPGILKNGNAKALMQDIYTELSELNAVLIEVQKKEKKDAEPKAITTVRGIEQFVKNNLDTLPEDQAKGKYAEIVAVLGNEFNRLNTPKSSDISILTKKIEDIISELESKTGKLADKIKDNMQQFLVALKPEPVKQNTPEKKEAVIDFKDFKEMRIFLTTQLANTTITEESIKHIIPNVSVILEVAFQEAKNTDALQLEAYGNAVLDLNAKLVKYMKSEKDKAKRELIETVYIEITKILDNIDAALTTQPQKAPETTPTPTPTPEAAPTPSSKRTIEDMVDIGGIDDLAQIPAELKNDMEYNAWIERMLEKGYSGPKKKYEAWYEVYVAHKAKMETIKDAFEDKKFINKLFINHESDDDKKFAKKRQLEELEFTLLNDPEGERKINAIIETYTRTQGVKGKIDHLEASRKNFEDAKFKGGKLEADMVYSLVHGPEAERKKIDEMANFLGDMDSNYEFYRGSIKNDDEAEGIPNMLALYKKSRGAHDNHINAKINRPQRWLSKLRNYFSTKPIDYDDHMTFRGKIRALRDTGLVETSSTSKVDARANMNLLKNFVREMQAKVREGKTVEEAKELSKDMVGKVLFEKMYPEYINSVANNSRMQEKAISSDIQKQRYASLDGEIKDAKNILERFEDDLVGVITEDDQGKFEEMVRQELSGQKLDMLANKLGRPDIDKKTLAELTTEFKKVDERGADQLKYKRVSLQLSQAEVRLIAKTKDTDVIPTSKHHYENIFQSTEIPNEKKIEYIDEVVKLLRENTNTGFKTTMEQLFINKLIQDFESKKSQFQK